ncbi:hypothetical protein [Lentzea sp. NEAU-D7]|uniref:hypothetical protein n=1 Tax=Lentzea sp. NEAU-D7 TaxID=2994667 RepID=UPI00224AF988|nr:hypothetical protein [Lentzea sp. NEAU-D7]MCX2955428.1 hypothetical protein [Lentzea sp. NEAU-D7]
MISEMLFHRRAWSWWMPALQDALAMARQGEHRDAEAWILETLGDASVDAGDAAASIDLYREAMTIRAALGDRGGLAIGHVGLCKAFSKTGDYDAAIVHCEKARRISVEVDDMWQYSVATAYLAMARAALGLVEEASDLLSATRAALDNAGDLMSSERVAVLQRKHGAGVADVAVGDDRLDRQLDSACANSF